MHTNLNLCIAKLGWYVLEILLNICKMNWQLWKICRMVKSIRFLKSLRKTYANWCATLDSMIPRGKIGNIIDNIVDNDHVDKTGQLAWAQSGSQKSKQ